MAKLVKCKSCEHEVDESAKTCPNCGVSSPGMKPGEMAKGCLGIIVFALIGSAILATCSEDVTPEQRAEKTCTSDFHAAAMAQKFVRDRLKSPSTADFVGSVGAGIQASYIGECTHIIVGKVDAQNSFGATVRNTYMVELKYNKADDTYSLMSLDIE
ncbi:hypothetical protein GCM10007891_05620 [Methylophaga thalassica]|uniref:Zinc-ribbon domain-containing protein n=1 Tax=Methylophaga thalassica TaxID=40223 RepID=A0ABQ5TSL1_9GAMM|nr:hypothetical protein [Methylophaga thalassica]GLP98708.1 hypothetical protein GCM10007891_05620 [Methylophaga thalassica]